MDRDLAMLLLLGVLVSVLLFFLALFAVAPIFTSCLVSLLYTLYVFVSNESHGIHHAQEFENRFWTVFTILLSTSLFFARDSPIAFGRTWPTLGFLGVLFCGYGMHIYDRHLHRLEMSRQIIMKRGNTATTSLHRLVALGIPIEEQLKQINSCLSDIDQLLIPSTVNNFIHQRFILRKEREIISIFEEAEQKTLNSLILHSKLGLLFYKIKDHRNFNGQHRSELIELLAVERISQLHVSARVVILHALQMLKLPAHSKSESWVRHILLSTKQDDLSDLKTLYDAKGDYFCMKKLLFDDIRSEAVRQDVLKHIQREAKVQLAHMTMGTKKSKQRNLKAWRKILSDVDDTLTCSGGSYPAGLDKRYGKKVLYPGVLAFYRELDLGIEGADEWPMGTVGNLVFLSARPHLYKDVSEKRNFAKFEKLRHRKDQSMKNSIHSSTSTTTNHTNTTQQQQQQQQQNHQSQHQGVLVGMHTIPSLLSGDLASGKEFILTNDFEPLAQKKFENFRQYASIYPEFKHVFICDNGQGDVRAGELMLEAFPKLIDAVFIHRVQPIAKTYKYKPQVWRTKGIKPVFFSTYPDAGLTAATRKPTPLIKISGLKRICQEAIMDFYSIQAHEWPSLKHKLDRRDELNQSIWRCNQFLQSHGEECVPLMEAEQVWKEGQMIKTPYGVGLILSFDPVFDLYEVALDWRPLDIQVAFYKKFELKEGSVPIKATSSSSSTTTSPPRIASTSYDTRGSGMSTSLSTVEEGEDDEGVDTTPKLPTLKRHETAIITTASPCQGLLPRVPKLADDLSSSTFLLPESSMTSTVEQSLVSRSQSTGVEIDIEANLLYKQPVSRSQSVSSPPSPVKGDLLTTTMNSSSQNKGPVKGESFNESHVLLLLKDKQSQFVRAKLQRRCLHKFAMPTLPNIPKSDETRSSFSFWDTSKSQPTKPLDVDNLSKDTLIQTPFGEGRIIRPVSLLRDRSSSISSKDGTRSKESSKTMKNASVDPPNISVYNTMSIGISLTKWTLANQSHPTLYCSVENALKWKKQATGNTITKTTSTVGNNNLTSISSTRLLSKFGTIVSQLITGPSDKSLVSYTTASPQKKLPRLSSSTPLAKPTPIFERYFKDGAAVTTPFGDGIVHSFRPLDGFYEVLLTQWKLKNGKCGTAYLRRDNISCHIAKGCLEGYPVLTSLGLSGKLISVEPTTGVHTVTVSSAGLICYLRPECVIRPLKASVGEDVSTPYGEGKVVRYRPKDNMYEISLAGATLYAKAENFDRVSDSLQDEGGRYGMRWLLGLIFQSSSSRSGGSQRSRSNSFASQATTSFASQTGTSRSQSSTKWS